MGVPPNGWLLVENTIEMDDLGVPLFQETSICIYIYMYTYYIYIYMYIHIIYIHTIIYPVFVALTLGTCAVFLSVNQARAF